MKLIRSTVFVAFALVLATGSASAQPVPQQMQLPNVMSTAPGLSLEARLDFTNFDDEAFLDEVELVSFNLQVQFLTASNFGFYVNLPVGWIDGPGDDEGAIGNLELGGLYVIRSSPSTDFYLQGALALDTADDEGEFVVPLAHVIARPADAFVTGFDTSWFRVAGGIRHAAGPSLRIGGRLGLDFPLDDNDDSALLTLAGSLGFEQPTFGLSFGLALLQVLDDDNADDDDGVVALNIMGDFKVGSTARLFVAFGTNFEDDFDGYSLGVGLRFGL